MDPTPEQQALIDEQPLGILATVRKDGSPQLTPIYYAYVDGQILISITKTRVKYHNIKRNPQVSMCIVKPEGRPYTTVYGRAEIEEQDIVEGTRNSSASPIARCPTISRKPCGSSSACS